jgi:hypothetical protein
MRNAPPHPRPQARRSDAWPPDGRIVAHEREEALVRPAQAQTKQRITPSSRRASPADAVHSRRPAPRKTRTAPRPTLPERSEARMRNARPERGMLRRLRVRTAEFPLNVHVVNVAVPPDKFITRDLDCAREATPGFPP